MHRLPFRLSRVSGLRAHCRSAKRASIKCKLHGTSSDGAWPSRVSCCSELEGRPQTEGALPHVCS